jgi:hypothetical protein
MFEAELESQGGARDRTNRRKCERKGSTNFFKPILSASEENILFYEIPPLHSISIKRVKNETEPLGN